MGNCCAAQKPPHKLPDDSKRPLRPPSAQTMSDQGSSNTRPSTPGAGIVPDDDKKDQQAGEQTPTGNRINGLNQLDQLQPRDPPSQTHSLQSSTIPGETTSINSGMNRTSLRSPSNSIQNRIGNRKSVISVVSEFKQDSVDLDEQVANVEAIQELRKNKEIRAGVLSAMKNQNSSKSAAAQRMPRLDLGIPQEPRKQIYQITSEFPVQRPYSVTTDWQKVLERYSASQQQFINDKPVDTSYDELADGILALSNRNWIRDILKMHMENRLAQQDSLSNLVKQKQGLQLREHFTWMVWAVAQYYFGAPERASGTSDEFDYVQFHSRATIPDQDVSAFEEQDSLSSIASRAKKHDSAANTSIFSKQTEPSKPKVVFNCKLPKTNSSKWSEGFSFKGVYFKLLPYEDSTHVQEEIKALRSIQTELLDLQAQEQAYLSQQQEYTTDRSSQNNPFYLNGSFTEGRLHKDMILPLLVGVKSCGFFLYGTPQIYTQEVRSSEENKHRGSSFRENLVGSNTGSIINLDSDGYISDDLGFSLPRFSSVNPPAGTGYQNFDQLNRRGSFNYLHDNIDEETLKDPVLQRMPLLKNMSRRNLIPVIDFEQFNKNDFYSSGLSNNSGLPPNVHINYLTVYLSSALRSLSTESAASVLFTVPSSAGEDIVFYPYPVDKTIAFNELDSMLMQNNSEKGNGSMQPLGDREEVKGQGANSAKKNGLPEQSFSRKFMAKHGWNCFMIEKQNTDQRSKFSMRCSHENKRATSFFSLRENSAGGLEALLNARDTTMSIIVEDKNDGNGTPDKARNFQQTPSSNPFMKAKASENLESTPRIKMQMAPGIQNSATRASQQIFVSPNKKTVLKRQDANKDDQIHGNVTISAVFNRGFKVVSSITQHQYANGIETMFQLSLEQVAKILDTSDRVSNIDALKDLMHRKGLNLRFMWVLLTKVKLNRSRELIMVAILLRTMRKVVNEEVKIGSSIKKPGVSGGSGNPFLTTTQSSQMPANSLGAFFRMSNTGGKPQTTTSQAFQKTTNSQQLTARAGQSQAEAEHFQGNRIQLFRECLTLYANAIMKNKFAKYKQVFDESLLGLFLSRLKIMTLAHSLDLSQAQLNYLESKDILDHVLEVPSQNPILFLNAINTYFNIDFKKEFTRLYRQDKYHILSKPQPIGRSDIMKINFKVQTYFSLREHAYFILARKISYHSKRKAAAARQRRSKDNVRNSQNASIAKAFQRPGARNMNSSMQSFDMTQTDRTNNAEDTPRVRNGAGNPRMNNNFMGGNQGGKGTNDTHRKFQNLQLQSQASGASSMYQNIIDLSKGKRMNAYRPARYGELLFPPNLYKLQTNSNAQPDNLDSATTFMPYYEMPNIDIINEWVIVLESLLNDVYSVQGCEAVLLEALSYQCIMALFLEQDADSSFKVLAKVRDLLHQAFVCPPELIVMCMTLMGLWQDLNEEIEQFPIESEKHYIAALITAFQIYGDPRGRGNYSVPFYLFFAWKLSLLALADGKKLQDSELSEELFDSALVSLFNHKRMYKNNQIELLSAQEQANNSGKLNQTPSTSTLPVMGNLNSSTFIRQGQLLQFEMTMDHLFVKNSQFNINKYRKRNKNVVTAGGFVKTSYQQPASIANASAIKPSGDNKLSNRMSSAAAFQQSSRSSAKQPKNQPQVAAAANYRSNYDLEVSELDIEIKIEDDSDRQRLNALNFKETETVVGKQPFPHWTINRQILQSQENMLAGERPNEAKQMKKEMVRDQLTKSVDMDALFPWMVTYNPIMSQTGLVWDAKTIKEVVFGQNSQIVGNSEPSSVNFSNHKMSQYSYRSNTERMSNTTRRRAFLNPYSTYIGKEVGGIQKGEVLGQLYSWGTDQYGQLGLEYFITHKQMGAHSSLKVLQPRLTVPLKDELIKEVCCGYAHTLAINQYGQMFSWGHNDSGQLGIGVDNVPDIVRYPVLNTHIKNVAKLAAGHEHSLALTKTQDLYVWGTGSLTGLNTEEVVAVPTHLDFFTKAKSATPLLSNVNKIATIACGGLHTAVVTQDGELFTWGSTEGGQLGHEIQNEEPSVKQPTRVEYFAEHKIKIAQVSCGEAHTVVLTSDDQVWGWGMSMYGQLGLGFSGDSFEPGEGMERSKVSVPTEITQYMPPEVTVAKIICGAAFTMFLTTENELYGCGINDLGQLGLDTYLEEMQIAVLDRARQAAGSIRDVITSDVTVPSRVICFEGLKVNFVCCGESHSLALIGEEKSLWAWGMYRNGQLGLGEVTQKMNPRPVQTLHTTNIHKLAAGSQHSLALLGDSNQLTAMAQNFFLNSDMLTNPWGVDYRRLQTEGPSKGQNYNDISIAQKPMV